VRGTDRIPMAPLAKDVVPGVLVHRVVARQEDLARRHQVIENPTGQAPRQPPARPAPFAEDAVVAGGMAGGQGAERTQEITAKRISKDTNPSLAVYNTA